MENIDMTFLNTFDIGNIIAGLSFIAVVIGGIVSLYQYSKSIKLKRADYIYDLIEKIRTDKEISPIIYKIEYGERWYDANFHGGKIESQVDKTLSYFAYICYLKKQKIISDKEFEFFKYQVNRILTNDGVIDYFYNLYHFANKFNTPISFKHLFDYGKNNKMFNDDFYDSSSYINNPKYHKYLNF